jgi:hypothetical protein
MRSTWLIRAARFGLAGALLAATIGASVASAGPAPNRGANRRGASLFALVFGVMNVNRIFCGINNIGELCVDPTGSPVVGGGFWPKGTPDQYNFNAGLQLAGTIPANAGFAWAGDTIGAFFMDPRGDQLQGDPITLTYNSLDPGDAASWPNGGVVRDTAIYAGVLIGRNSISQEDLWVRTWDGNPALLAGRTHPMGVLVEERVVGWNYPTGNEDIIYFIFNFTNVTAFDDSVYDNSTTINPLIKGEIKTIGKDFAARNQARFNVQIPTRGYAFTNLFAAFFMDCDVGDASKNYSTPIIPFNMSACWKSDFLEKNWTFPTDIFGPPFVASPGFLGVKYLRSPNDATGKQIGLTIWSNTLNAATGYPDPIGVKQLYRYLSGTSSPASGDFPCTITGQTPLQRHWCFQAQNFADTRFFQSSGPFTLSPGESKSIVVAYIQAAPTPVVSAYVGGDFKPGVPETGADIVGNAALVRPIEHAMGWISQNDNNLDGIIEQNEVTSVPRSLLDKALVAQAIFDNKFLLPFAPDAPPFFLIPGDNQVTVVWQKSKSETTGNPFFVVASDPTSPLYDPNFRQIDTQGYRIYRGRTTSALSLVAQFDYAGQVITDFTGAFAYTADLNGDGKLQCAPELGVQADCPVRFQTAPPYINSNPVAISSPLIQIPAGGRVLLADSSTLILKADTAVTGGGSGFPALTNDGVNFAFSDLGVRNSFTYYYAVTAFSINSLKSGPSSLESPRVTKLVTPRAPSAQVVNGQLSPLQLLGQDGTALNANASLPTLDATTGEFSGPMPPTNGVALGLAAFLPQILDSGTLKLTVDSVQPGYGSVDFSPGVPLTYFLTFGSKHYQIPVNQDVGATTVPASVGFSALNAVQKKATVYGGDSTFPIYGSAGVTLPGSWRITAWGRGQANSNPGNSSNNGPRWWSGTPNENTADPNRDVCVTSRGTCAPGVAGFSQITNASQNAGRLINAGNDTVRLFHVQGYSTVGSVPQRDMETILSGVARAADFQVFWGTAGKIDSVHDVTHHVTVPFSSRIRASWGLLTNASFTTVTGAPDGNNALLTWSDIYCVSPARFILQYCGSNSPMQNTATLSPIAVASTHDLTQTPGLTTTGNGFIFYLNGHFFLMQMNALPAAGTVWNARFYSGAITGSAGSYSFVPAVRPPAVPGLTIKATFTGTTVDPTKTTDAALAKVHTVPDPYYVTDALEATANTKVLKFVNLPAEAIIRIYSLSGVLVQVLTHNDASGGGEQLWNLRNRNNQFVASGVYFWHVETPDGRTKVGRFTVVNFAP